ncbi:MAG: redoxin domain-containing protein [Alphaproteobacteria bacterium]
MKLLNRRIMLGLAVAVAAVFTSGTGQAAGTAKVDAPAPGFEGVAASGRTISLDAYRGKTVVLEWTSHECPYVRKHYGAGNMQQTQRDALAKGAVWLTVISSAPGEEGYVEAAEAMDIVKQHDANPTEIILDPKGEIGRMYGARTTPHMYIVDPDGVLKYMGGIDSIPSARQSDIPKATNYVTVALNELAAGKPVSNPVTRAYGCSVKYAW